MMMLTSGRLVPMISLREVSGSSDATMPAAFSSGVVSSKMRPFDRAILTLIWVRSVRAADTRAQLRKFFLDAVVTAVEMVDAIDQRLAVGHQAGNHQAGRRPQVGRH